MTLKESLIENVLKPIENKGFKAYFVGGCVRDELMNKNPHDYDICTNATPNQLHTIFDCFSNVSKNSEKFGVTMVLVAVNGIKTEIEIATFRKDITKGRHPTIDFTNNIIEDANRRDFTINALYEDINGNILDPTNFGVQDIKNNILRFVGNPKERLSEDPLRAFRFVRFLAQKGFNTIYSDLEIRKMSSNIDYSNISTERKLKELKQIFAGKYFTHDSISYNTGVNLKVWEDIGLQDIFYKMDTIEQAWRWHAEGGIFEDTNGELFMVDQLDMDIKNCKPIEHGTVLMHTFLTWKAMNDIIHNNNSFSQLDIDMNEENRFILILGSILHDIGKCYCSHLGMKHNVWEHLGKTYDEVIPKVVEHPITGVEPASKFCKSLGMSNEEVHKICSIVAHHMEAHELANKHSKHDIWKFTKHENYLYIMLVALADERGSIKLQGFDERGCMKEILNDERVIYCMNNELPKPILNGDDLIKYGRKPSPLFKKMLETAYKLQIDQNITDKEMLYKMVKNVSLNKEGN